MKMAVIVAPNTPHPITNCGTILAAKIKHLEKNMAPHISIENIADFVGQTVTIKGWLYNSTRKGKLMFLRLRDGSGMTQGVAFRPDVGDELFEELKRLGQESAVIISGIVQENGRAPGLPKGYEIGVQQLEVVQAVDDYPITPKDHGVEFLMDNRHLWLRSSQQW
ncbi:Asparaginyl-tRNA synthetase, partial [hydrothermal vent metagenome]